MARYLALIDGKAGAYGVVVPDLPGCTAMGRTVDEALRNAIEAVRDWTEAVRSDGVAVPAPGRIRDLRKDKDIGGALAAGAVIAAVPLFLKPRQPVKGNRSPHKNP